MSIYEIKYHLASRQCCGRGQKPSTTHRIEANNKEEAKRKLKEVIPGVRFESIKEVTE